jgi:hypothetical protein
MAMELFSKEYDYLRQYVKAGNFVDPAKKATDGLKTLMTDDGFDAAGGAKLDLLRKLLQSKEGEHILKSVGLDPKANTPPDGTKVIRAAALKFMRHLYLIRERGAQKVWVFSSPKNYRHHPSDELWAKKTSIASIKQSLDEVDEQFSARQKKALSEATTTGLAWCHKVTSALTKSDDKINEKLKRWFGTSTTTDAELKTICAKLLAGFKKITATINSNHLIFTDMPSIRGATGGDEKGLLDAYAFVYAGRYEKLPIVYIEKAYFSKNSTPIATRDLWALTVVHELTHLDCSTKDHRYDYSGLEVGANLTAAQALDNADSWAYFCADIAGALSRKERTSALKGWA